MSDSLSNYLYNITHKVLFSPLASAYAQSYDAINGSTESAAKSIAGFQCPHCAIFWVPGWNLLVRIKYSKGKRRRIVNSKSCSKQNFRKRTLVYRCLNCTHKTVFDGIAQEKATARLVNPPAKLTNGQKKGFSNHQKVFISNNQKESENTPSQKSKIMKPITKNKKKKHKHSILKKSSEKPDMKKKESLSLLDFMSSDP